MAGSVPDDPRIRNLESSDVGYNDIRQQTGARRTRWPQLLSQYEGRIDAVIDEAMLGDTFDVYLMRIEAFDFPPTAKADFPSPYWPELISFP